MTKPSDESFPSSVSEELSQYTTNLTELRDRFNAHRKKDPLVPNDLVFEIDSLIDQMSRPDIADSLTIDELCVLSDRSQAAIERGVTFFGAPAKPAKRTAETASS